MLSETAEAVGSTRDSAKNSAESRRQRRRISRRPFHSFSPFRYGLRPAAAVPTVVYLAIKLFGIVMLAALSAANGESVGENLNAWDAKWYLEIAANGYAGVDPSMVDGHGDRHPGTSMAFFPGLPLLIRLVATLGGITVFAAGVLVSLAAGVCCAHGLARLGRLVGGSERAGLLLVALFAAAPMSIVLSMPYTEATFCALAVWALLGVVERRWLLAGVCCAAAGLLRPTAAALVAVVGLAALVAIIRRRDGAWPWVAGLLAPVGMLGYLGWVAARIGRPDGYFVVQQRGWSSAFDGGAATAGFVVETLFGERSAFETFTAWIVLAAIALLIVCVRWGMPWPLVLFAFLVLLLDLGSNGLMYSKVRLMLPAFPLLLPVAVGLAARRRTTAVGTTALFVCFGTWFGAYALTVWPYAI